VSVIRLQAKGATEPVDVRLERGRSNSDATVFHVGERVIEAGVELDGPHRGCLRIHGRVVPFVAYESDDSVQVWIDGRIYALQRIQRTARRVGGAGAAGARETLTAPMPGTILKVALKPGATFEAHQPIIIMESMKMETTLSLPHPGTVLEIACKPGDMVAMGAVLARVKGAAEGDEAS